MATIINERDAYLAKATARVIPVVAPVPVVIPGYTGIQLTTEIAVWYFSSGPNNVAPASCEMRVALKGIPQNTPIVWTCNVPLTDTDNPLVKVVLASTYPADRRATQIQVSVNYAGQTFTDQRKISVFSG